MAVMQYRLLYISGIFRGEGGSGHLYYCCTLAWTLWMKISLVGQSMSDLINVLQVQRENIATVIFAGMSSCVVWVYFLLLLTHITCPWSHQPGDGFLDNNHQVSKQSGWWLSRMQPSDGLYHRAKTSSSTCLHSKEPLTAVWLDIAVQASDMSTSWLTSKYTTLYHYSAVQC